MKKIILSILIPLVLISCKKEPIQNIAEDGMVAHYSLNGNTFDQTVFRNHGNSNANYTFDRFGNPNSAMSFTQHQFQSEAIPIQLSGKYTFSFWVKINTYRSGMAVMELSKNRNCDLNPQIWQTNNTLFLTTTTNINNNIPILYEITKFHSQKWIHILWTVDNNITTLFVNNIMIDSKYMPWPNIYNVDLTLGNSGNKCGYPSNYLNQASDVYIDDVRIYNRVLSKQEISKLYY